MTPKDFWEIYAAGFTPLSFMRLFHCQDPSACAEAYVSERPAVFGIVRRGSWRETFAAGKQHTRTEVCTALAAYLAETESEWRGELDSILAAAVEERVSLEAPPETPEDLAPPREEEAADADAGGDPEAPV